MTPGSDSVGTRVFVGNLAWRVKWQDLKDHMKQAGDVKFAEIITVSGGRSKGCGIVEYADAESARRAIEELNDTTLFDRKMFVREDRETGRSPSPMAAGGNRMSNTREAVKIPVVTSETAGRQLYVTNLPWACSWRDLKELFGGQDTVERAEVACDRDGRSRGYGCVIMKSPEAAQDAIARFDGYDMNGREIAVRIDNGPPPHNAGGRQSPNAPLSPSNN